MTFRSILVATDFSPEATTAVEAAAELARRSDAKLTVLHVYPAPGVMLPDGFIPATPQVLRDLQDAIDRSLAELRARVQAPGLAIVSQSVQGAAATEICRAAGEGGHDLVVVGTHGRTGLKRLLLGSVAERVVREAPCPVLVARARA